jgi:glycosyltransferase involved in cell wall biosynthesis
LFDHSSRHERVVGNPLMRVQMVCQFGAPVRGLSPYADALRAHLAVMPGLELETVDFASAYPSLLHPAERGGIHGQGELHWARPWTWARVARQPADVLHIQHWAAPLSTYLWPLATMARRHGKRVVVTVHNANPHEQTGRFMRFEDRLLMAADALIVHGEVARHAITRRLGSGGPVVTVIAHGVNVLPAPVMASQDDHQRLGLSPDRRYVLLFGNLRGYKGVEVLLAAWAKARQSLPDVDLIVAGRLWGGSTTLPGRMTARLMGTAGDAARLRTLLADDDLMKNVIVRHGFQSDEDIDALIRVCALAVFPYRRFSGQSGAACRAAAMGRPVLVSRVGALPDVAIDETWQLPPSDTEALANSLVDKLRDPAIANVAATQQLEAVRANDWHHVADAHLRLYREIT